MGSKEDYSKLPGNINRDDYDNGHLKFSDYFSTPPMFFTKDLCNVPIINRYPNGHAFIIAGGPSFKNIDKSKLSMPGVLTIGINNSPASFRPNLWTCVDSPSNFLASIWLDPKIEKIVPISHIDKKLFDSEKWQDIDTTVGECPNVVYYRRNEVFDHEEYLFEDTINWGNHSNIGGGRSVFLAAIRIAFLLGIRNLYLLGVDFRMDKNNHYHFPQDRSNGSINGNMGTYNSMKKWFSQLKELFDQVGYNVYNCNPDSELKAFPFLSFDEAINMATSVIPKAEKTDGMYSRKNDESREKAAIKAKVVADNYTDDDRKQIKKKLDKLRSDLDGAKNDQYELLVENFPDHSIECHNWAHKLKKPTEDKLIYYYDKLKEAMKIEGFNSDDVLLSDLYKSQLIIDEVRKEFNDCKKEKNKIFGIV